MLIRCQHLGKRRGGVVHHQFLIVLAFFLSTRASMSQAQQSTSPLGEDWAARRPSGLPSISHLEVMCGSTHMEVHLQFNKPFSGLVTSKGMYGSTECTFVSPGSSSTNFVFNIYYDRCGTKPDNHGKFYENTIVVQYDEALIEAWDEAKRLRCEWFNDYEKTATKTSPMVISDLEIVELNFHGDNVDCWMEIQEGKGPWGPPLNGIAPLGSPLTMVIAVKDPSGEFDMRVKACEAGDGEGGPRALQLSNPEGCSLRPKLMGSFSKVKLDDGRATVLTYAYLSAFKFPDKLNVHLRCTVEICRHGCPDHCSGAGDGLPLGSEGKGVAAVAPQPPHPPNRVRDEPAPLDMRPPPPPYHHPHHQQYGGRPQRAPYYPLGGRPHFDRGGPGFTGRVNPLDSLLQAEPKRDGEVEPNRIGVAPTTTPAPTTPEEEKGKREMLMEATPQPLKDNGAGASFPKGPRHLRVRRSVPGPSDVIGVQGLFRVVSQADLNFALNPTLNSTLYESSNNGSPQIVLGDPVYGSLCLPRSSFSFILFGLGLSSLISVMIATALGFAHCRLSSAAGKQRRGGGFLSQFNPRPQH